MNIPGYDAWKLAGPDDDDQCPECDDRGVIDCMVCGGDGEVDDCGTECPACEGSGRAECSACSAEPDGDYEYERRRDAMLDKP